MKELNRKEAERFLKQQDIYNQEAFKKVRKLRENPCVEEFFKMGAGE